MSRSILFIFLGLLLIPLTVVAQNLLPGPQVLTFFSDVDDTEQPYGIYIPPNYDPQKKYPLVIMLHGAGSNHRLALRRVFGKSNANGENDVEASRYFPKWKDVDFIVASPFARGTAGYQGVAEKDVYDVLNDVRKRFSTDEDRTYLTGLSMGGGGTLWIGLTRPDIWAALAPVCPAPPRGTEHYLPNSFNIPMHFFHGDADKAVPVSVSRDWVKKLKENGTRVEYAEYPGVEHNSWENAYTDGFIFSWFQQFKRNPFPDEVKFSTTQYEYSQAYWVRIDEFNPGTVAKIEARFTGENQLLINASNVGAFTLKLTGHAKYKSALPLQVTLNTKKLKITSSDSVTFQFVNGKWVNGPVRKSANAKRTGLEGPIGAAFSSRHIYVYGTGGNASPSEIKARMEMATEAANWSAYRNAFLGRIMVFPRIVADRDVRPSDYETCNLILFGTEATNSVIAKYSSRLPLHLKTEDKEVGLLYVFPEGGHYVVVNSGLPWWNTETVSASAYAPTLPVQFVGDFKDYILYRGSAKSVLAEGYFGPEWDLSADQRKTLLENGVMVR